MITKYDIELVLWCVLKPEATERWWDTEVSSLGNQTPREAFDAGNREAVAHLVISYLDPGFS